MPTRIAKLFTQPPVGSHPTSSIKNDLLENFKSSKEYRHAFVEEKVRTQLAIQTKTIREQRGMSRPALAKLMEKANSWVFRLEDPNQSPPTIPTLLKVAEAFDVDLEISFRPFSRLLNRLQHMTADSFAVPSFNDEIKENTFGSKMDEAINDSWTLLQRHENGKGAGGQFTDETDSVHRSGSQAEMQVDPPPNSQGKKPPMSIPRDPIRGFGMEQSQMTGD